MEQVVTKMSWTYAGKEEPSMHRTLLTHVGLHKGMKKKEGTCADEMCLNKAGILARTTCATFIP
eukprot:scaffold152660_cov17-Tisochrysis_lutea.AAC.3